MRISPLGMCADGASCFCVSLSLSGICYDLVAIRLQ
jgi:hypothetical protein